MAIAFPKTLRYAITNIPLRWVLVVPFVLQTVGAVALVGYLSYRSGQQSVVNLSQRLMVEAGERTTLYLKKTLEVPHLVNQLNADAIRLGLLPGFETQNPALLEKFFLHQISRFSTVSTIAIANERGGMVGAGQANPLPSVYRTQNFTRGVFSFSDVDSHGNAIGTEVIAQNYDARTRPWYQTPKHLARASWSPIYQFVARDPILGISAGLPIYHATGKLQGVLATDITLNHLNQFLAELQISQSGQVFIIERSGLLVASSTNQPLFTPKAGKLERIKAAESDQAIIRETIAQLTQSFGNLTRIDTLQQFQPQQADARRFVAIMPFQDRFGLDWLIVIVVPESDFMAEIHANNGRTALLCCLTLLAATAIGALTARWITKPILRLSQASQALAQGEWQHSLSTHIPIAELKTLTHAFNQTADQLQQVFQRINAALEESREKFTTVFRASPDPIAIVTLGSGRILEANDRWLEFYGYSRAELIGKTTLELDVWANLEDRDRFLQALQTDSTVHNLEVKVKVQSGVVKTVLAAAEICNLEGQDCVIVIIRDISDRKQAEEFLRRNEEQLRLLADALPVFIAYADTKQCYRFVNKLYETWFGLSREQILGCHTRDIIGEPNYALSRPYIEQALAGESPCYEITVPDPQRGDRHLSVMLVPDFDGQSHVRGYYSLVIDISDRKRAEIALQRYERIVSATTDAISLLDRHYCYQIVNQAYLDWNNRSYHEIVGHSVVDLMGQAIFETVVKPRLDRCLAGETVQYSDWFVLPALGRQFLNVTYSPYLEIDQTISGVVVNVHNLTPLKQAEAALRQSEERFQQLAANLPGVIYTIVHAPDGSTRLEYVSAALEELFEIKPEQALENFSLLLRYWHPEDIGPYRAAVRRNLETLEPFSCEWRVITPSGKLRWLHAHRSQLQQRDNGELVGYGVVQDVSDRHSLDRVKDEFISVVSHELRTPLTAIRGSLGILETGTLDDKPETAKQMLKVALNNSERLVKLVNDILDLERLESGKTQLELQSCDVSELIQQAVDSVQAIAVEARITIAVTTVATRVQAAPDAIVQVLTNLLGNAIKFSSAGSTVWLSAQFSDEVSPCGCATDPMASSSAHPLPPPTPRIRFVIKDQGRGIPPDKLETIFGRFQQVDVSDSRRKGGTGLGLAICKSIVQQHNEQIWVESVVGKGSTFYFTLKLALDSESAVN